MASDKIPDRRQRSGFRGGIAEENVVKVYHELSDAFGNPLTSSRTFNSKERDARRAYELNGAPPYL